MKAYTGILAAMGASVLIHGAVVGFSEWRNRHADGGEATAPAVPANGATGEAMQAEPETQVLLDVKDPSQDDGMDRTFLASAAARSRGRLTEEKGLNMEGDSARSSSLEKGGESGAWKNGEGGETKARNDRFGTRNRNDQRALLRFDEEGVDFQVGAEKFEHTAFYQSFFHAVMPSFQAYLRSGAWSARMVRGDVVTVLARVSPEGRISFAGMLRTSSTQPWMNHVAQGMIENAGSCDAVPRSLLLAGEEAFDVPLTLSLQGQPGWWTFSVPKPAREDRNP